MKIEEMNHNLVGRWVVYFDGRRVPEVGKISSWNSLYIFVVFHCNNEWERFFDFTAAGCNPEDLFLIPVKGEN